MILLSSREDLIFFWQAVRIGADHLNPIRDWADLRLSFRHYKDWPMCGLFPLLWCSPSENSNCKPRTRTTATNYWKLHSTSLVAFCLSLTHCSAFIQNSLRVRKHLQREPSTVYIYLLSLLNLDSSSFDWFRSSTMPSNGFFSLAFQVVSRSLSLLKGRNRGLDEN